MLATIEVTLSCLGGSGHRLDFAASGPIVPLNATFSHGRSHVENRCSPPTFPKGGIEASTIAYTNLGQIPRSRSPERHSGIVVEPLSEACK